MGRDVGLQVDAVKELFMAAHEELIAEYLERHPGASWTEAYEATGDDAYYRMRDNLADAADRIRKRVKEEGGDDDAA